MPKDKLPITQAVRMLKEKEATFTLRTYKYEDKGGTPVASRELGVPEHQVIKTLVMEDERKNPLLILMHGTTRFPRKISPEFWAQKALSPAIQKQLSGTRDTW